MIIKKTRVLPLAKRTLNRARKPAKVLVAMSGGVDSSVAAQLLKNQGYEVAGVFLHFWKDPLDPTGRDNGCCSITSFADAKAVAAKIGIPLYTFNFAPKFKKAVVDYFLDEYKSGLTPNPCVVCNREIKMAYLLKEARKLGFDYIASGHYARVVKVGSEFRLLKAKDTKKDQTYFLYTFKQHDLSGMLFPVGDYIKAEVREIAKKYDLITASKAESQDICFVGTSHAEFLKRYLRMKPGEVRLWPDGRKLGRHDGLPLYTIGQRKGLPADGGGPYYVVGSNYNQNILYVVDTSGQAALFKKELVVKEVNWLSGKIPQRSFRCQAVIRYGHQPADCRVKPLTKGRCRVVFDKPQRAVSPGQSVVFYQADRLLGGGIIIGDKNQN